MTVNQIIEAISELEVKAASELEALSREEQGGVYGDFECHGVFSGEFFTKDCEAFNALCQIGSHCQEAYTNLVDPLMDAMGDED